MAREVIGTNIELAVVILVNGLVVNVPSKYLCYTHSTGLLSTFVREDSFHSGQQLMERFIKIIENKNWIFSPKRGVYIIKPSATTS